MGAINLFVKCYFLDFFFGLLPRFRSVAMYAFRLASLTPHELPIFWPFNAPPETRRRMWVTDNPYWAEASATDKSAITPIIPWASMLGVD